MSKRWPARSASGHSFNRSQASYLPSVKASRTSESGVLKRTRISDPVRRKQSSTLRIRWTCPPKFILNDEWLVATGEQSEERKFQEQRESGVYAIPICPSMSLDVKEDHDNEDYNIPIIPITPIEDDEADPLHEVIPPSSIISSVSAPKKHPADIGAAASAAFTALLQSNEQGSLIDTDLLIKILNDPKMVDHLSKEQLPISSPLLSNPKQEINSLLPSAVKAKEASIISDNLFKLVHGASPPMVVPRSEPLLPPILEETSNPFFTTDLNRHTILPPKQVHKASPPMVVPIYEPPLPPKLEGPSNRYTYTTSRPTKPGFLTSAGLNGHIISHILPPKQAISDEPLLPPKLENPVAMLNRPPIIPKPDISKLQVDKDHDYYKSLVRQHGLERQGDGNKVQNSLPKNCRYFNTPKGCRLGLSCPFRHHPGAKRVKLNTKILRL